MTGSWLRTGRRGLGRAVAVLLLAPILCSAESSAGSGSASARVRIAVTVPPVFRVLQVTRTPQGYDYRVWTNMKSVVIGGREYRFDRVGESTVRVPTAPGDTWVVHGL